MPNHIALSALFTLCLATLLAAYSPASAQGNVDDVVLGGKSVDWLVASAVLAAPAEYREAAEVRAWTADDHLVTLRPGSNDMICLADRPGDDRFRAACYHASLEPFMEAGRRLRREGLEGMERQRARWAEIEAGKVAMPAAAMVYNFGLDTEDFDPAEVDPSAVGRLQAMYMSGATAASTGLPTTPSTGPWLMFAGTPSAHIMISVPPMESSGGG